MSKAAHIMIALIITATLVNNDYFCNASLAAYFLFVISASALIFFTGVKFVTKKKVAIDINYAPVLFLFLLGLYYLLERLLQGSTINIINTYLLTNSLLLLSLSLLFKNKIINQKYIYTIIIIASLVEAFICIAQFAGLVKSQNEFLSVSGTWVNPNVTAMFLAISLPAVLRIPFFLDKRTSNWLRLSVFFIICFAIVLLKCRTAVIGAVVSVLIILNNRYNFLLKVKTKYSTLKKLSLMTLMIVLIVPIGLYTYYAKQNSADGRRLVWKNAAFLFSKNPFTGVGYGNFEHDYNLQQANYFESGNGTAQEINIASFVSMAYNEFLQNAVEGGAIGLLLFGAFISSLLIRSNKQSYQLSEKRTNNDFSGIVTFIVMSLFNFTIQAVPVMCLFIFYTSIFLANTTEKKYSFNLFQNKILVTGLLILPGILIFFTQLTLANAFAKTRVAINLAKDGNDKEAIRILKPLIYKMRDSETFWTSFGNTLYKQKNYKAALKQFKRASNFSSSPGLYMTIGNCYYKLRYFDSAINACTIAKNIAPKRLKPRYALMKIYEGMNDTVNVIKSANEIILLQPKVQSKEADFYKEEATKVLITITSKDK